MWIEIDKQHRRARAAVSLDMSGGMVGSGGGMVADTVLRRRCTVVMLSVLQRRGYGGSKRLLRDLPGVCLTWGGGCVKTDGINSKKQI